MSAQQIEGTHGNQAWDANPAAAWQEFVACRERYLAHLAAQSASWRAARRLPTRAGGRYAGPEAGQGEGARSR